MNYLKFLIYLFLPLIGFSQEGGELSLLAKNTAEGVKLKIIPSQMDIWFLGTQNGYHIERKNIATGETAVLNDQPILPAKESDWLKVPRGESFYKFHLSALEGAQPNLQGLSMTEKISVWEHANEGYPFYFLITTRVSEFSKLSGLEFEDKKAIIGESYVYSITINGHDNFVGNLNHTYSNHQPKSTSPMIQSMDKLAEISWPFINDDILVSFDIEKSDDGVHFKALNEAPIYYNDQITPQDSSGYFQAGHIHRQDSLENNYQDYYYRIIAIDVWGEKCIPSDTVVARGVDLTPPRPIEQLATIKNDSSEKITLQWEINYDEPIKGYIVYHSHENQGTFRALHEGILPPTTIQFTHDSIVQMEDQYYKVGTIDTAGNIGFSRSVYGFINDTKPPSAPQSIVGQCDSSGLVTLHWDSVVDRGLNGYMVYGSNSPEKGFINLTPVSIKTTSFVDTNHLNRLHSKRYYKVVALDKSFNFSDYSETRSVSLPDTIGPAAPLLEKIQKNGDYITLKWRQSVSQDIQKYNVQQKKSEDWITIATVDATSELKHQLKRAAFGELEFRVTGIDTSGNTGPPSYARSIKLTKSIEGKDLLLSIEKNRDHLQLSWTNIPARFYKIYRMEMGGSSRLLSMTRENEYRDLGAQKGNTYMYYIVGQNDKGRKISRSETITIDF